MRLDKTDRADGAAGCPAFGILVAKFKYKMLRKLHCFADHFVHRFALKIVSDYLIIRMAGDTSGRHRTGNREFSKIGKLPKTYR